MSVSNYLEAVKARLMGRRTAYIRVFDFDNSNARVVLEDLEKFCRASTSTFHADPRCEARLDGRREVWLRIQQHLRLSPDQLWKLYSGNLTQQQGE